MFGIVEEPEFLPDRDSQKADRAQDNADEEPLDNGNNDGAVLFRCPKGLGVELFTRRGFVPAFHCYRLGLFGANIIKVLDGGWFPLLLAAAVFLVMMTWKKGRAILARRVQDETQDLEEFLRDVERKPPTRVNGTAVFMNGNATRTPPALLHNLEHNKVLHERVLFLTVKTKQFPYVDPGERVEFEHLSNGFSRLRVFYGYMEDPNIPQVLEEFTYPGFVFNPADTTYFLGRETIIATKKYSGMARWREKLFSLLSRNATSVFLYSRRPCRRNGRAGRDLEIGSILPCSYLKFTLPIENE